MSAITLSSEQRIHLAQITLVAILFVAIASNTHAGPLVGVNPVPSSGPYLGDNENNDTITVGDSNNPVPITLDPTPSGAPWIKQFQVNRDGQGWSPGQSVTVEEWITFPPTSTLRPTDWHEDILPATGANDNFQWGGGSILIGTSTYPGVLSTNGKSIWFDFPPIPPSAPPVRIQKTIVWTDGVITPDQNGSPNNIYTITVREQPSIPEPGTMLLAWLAVLSTVLSGSRTRPQP
jgi:hypothetical protein